MFPVFLMFLDVLYLYLEVQWSLVSGNKTRARPDGSEISGHDVFGYFVCFFFVMLSTVSAKSSNFGLFRLQMVEILASLHYYSFPSNDLA